MVFKMLENHCTIPDSLSNPFFSAPGVILQLKFIHFLQNEFYIHYLHLIQQRLVNKELPKDSNKQKCFMLSVSIVFSDVDHLICSQIIN